MSVSKYNPERSAYWLDRYHARMQEGRDFLGNMCAACGETQGLEFDHIDPAQKSFTLTVEWSRAKEIWWAELQKCQLLCEACHLEKTVLEQRTTKHGTWGMYTNRKCRCDTCRRFVSEYHKALKERKKNKSL